MKIRFDMDAIGQFVLESVGLGQPFFCHRFFWDFLQSEKMQTSFSLIMIFPSSRH